MSVVLVDGMQQNPFALTAWCCFLRERPIANVLEIGTGLGGFAQFLSTHLKPGATLVTVDHAKRWTDAWPQNVIFVLHDAHQNSFVLEVLLWVMARPILLMCDGGNKSREVNHHGPLLQASNVPVHTLEPWKTRGLSSGWTLGKVVFALSTLGNSLFSASPARERVPINFLAVHNYEKDRDRFNERLKGKVWDWHECDEQAIASVLADGFELITEDDFSIAAWGVWQIRADVRQDASPQSDAH